jgi:Mg2+ and Co2+ transporter CorA
MNVPYPGSDKVVGFAVSVVIMVISATILYILFKKKEWI